jgi:hypothetical protein
MFRSMWLWFLAIRIHTYIDTYAPSCVHMHMLTSIHTLTYENTNVHAAGFIYEHCAYIHVCIHTLHQHAAGFIYEHCAYILYAYIRFNNMQLASFMSKKAGIIYSFDVATVFGFVHTYIHAYIRLHQHAAGCVHGHRGWDHLFFRCGYSL